MYALVKDGNITETFANPKAIKINDIQYAKNIFNIWSESELNAIGLYTVEENNTNLKDEFYYTNASVSYVFEDNKVKSSYGTPTPKNLTTLKTDKINEINLLANYKLQSTDWYVVKASEVSSYTIPSNIATYRASVRTKANDMETQINNASDVDALADLFIYTDGIRPLGEFPEL